MWGSVSVPEENGMGEFGMSVCMGSLYRCIVAFTHLGNSTGRTTATMTAPLLLTSGPVRYEALCFTVVGQAQWQRGWY